MKTAIVLRILTVSLMMQFIACKVDNLEVPANNLGPAVITSSMTGAEAMSAVLQARDLVVTSTHLYKNLGEFGFDVMASDPTLASANTDILCAEGGTYKYIGTYTGGTYSLTFTFAGCREDRFQYEGTYTLTGTPANISVALGSSSVTFNIFYFNSAYAVLIAYLKAQSSFTMADTSISPNISYTITPTGKITTFDYFLLNTFTMTFSRYAADYLYSTDGSGNQTTSIIANGYFSEYWSSAVLRLTFANFTVDRVVDAAVTGNDTSISGSVTADYSPNAYCLEGVMAVSTPIATHNDYGLDYTTLGTLTVTGTGMATAQYNSGGDIDVTVIPDPPINYAREYDLMKVCDVSALEQVIPPLLGPTGSATGSTMAVTLTWMGPAPIYTSTSDMDLHVKYYNIVAPVTATLPTWHIDWHQGKTYPGASGTCTDPVGISFSDAFDLDTGHTGTCDVGLDFDDTNGYGPEHITALQLPVGYYVVSVNSFSLPAAQYGTTLYLSLHIGDSIFGPYIINPVSASDGEGTTPAAWFRVADVRVNATANVDVLAPDVTLNPWGH